MNPYSKFGTVVRLSLPRGKTPRLTEQQIEKIKSVSGVALAVIGIAGVAALSVVAPNIFYAIGKIFYEPRGRHKIPRKEAAEKISGAFYYLKRHNLVKVRPKGRDFLVSLTSLGQRRFAKMSFESLQIKKPKRWDGHWWQVAADIPTKKYKRGADLLRMKLKELGFFPLQRTLWLYPFDPRREIEFVIDQYGIGRFVTVMEVNRLDRDDERKLKVFFHHQKIL